MKNHFNLIFIFALVIIIFTACKKDKEEGCTNPLATNYNPDAEEDDGSCIIPTRIMQARVNNSLIVFDSSVYVREDMSGNLFGITGIRKDGSTILITFPVSFGIGIYPFLSYTSGNSFMNEAFYWNDSNNPYHSYNGSIIVINYYENSVVGSFYFNAVNSTNTDSIEVIEGSYYIDF